MDKKLRLSLIFAAAGNAVNFLKGVKGESDRTAKALGAARQRVNELQRAAKDVSSFRAMETRLQGTRTALEAARAEARRLAAAHEATTAPTKAMSRAFDVAKAKLEELKGKEQGQVRALAEMESKLRAAGVSTNALGAHERGLARDLDRANSELSEQARRMDQVADRQRRMGAARGRYDKTQALASTMQGAGQSSLAAGVVAGAPVVLASQQAMGFEDGMADVRKVVDFDTPQQFKQMGNDILDLSTRIPVASEGLTQIVAAAGQAGIARGELLGFAEDAGKMGIAFDTTADEAGSMMAGWRTAFKMTQPQVRGLADQINYLGNTGPANAAAISNVVTRIGPLGEVAGLAAGQIAALGSTVVGMGVQEEVAATGIKNMMLALTSGEAATKAQAGAFKALGLDATVMARRMQTDAGGAITDVMERIAGLSPERQSAVLKQLFGSESIAAIAPLLTNLDLLKTNLNKVGDATLYSGSMQKEFESRAATTSNAMTLAQQGVKAVAVEIGMNFLPAIQAGSKILGKIATGVRNFSAAHPNAVKVVGALVAIVAGGLIVFGGLAMAVAAILGPFALMQLALTSTGILFAPVIAGLTGTGAAAGGAAIGVNALLWPVLLVVAAVALLAGAAFLIFKNWGTIGPWLGRLWEGVKSTVGTALSAIGTAILNFTPLGFIIRNWGPITNFLSALFGAVKAVVGLALDGLMFLLVSYTPLGAIMRNWGAITGYLSGVWNSAKSVVSSGIDGMRNVIAALNPLGALQTAFAPAFTWLGTLPGRLLNAGADAIRGFTQGISGQRANVQAATAAAAGGAETAARRRLDTHSPSRVFARIGRDVMAGLTAGIDNGADGPAARIRAAAAAVTAAGAIALPGAALADGTPRQQVTFDTGSRLAGGGPVSGSRASGAAAQDLRPSIGSVTIQIHQQPGEDMDALARRVRDLINAPNLAQLGDQGSDSHGETH